MTRSGDLLFDELFPMAVREDKERLLLRDYADIGVYYGDYVMTNDELKGSAE